MTLEKTPSDKKETSKERVPSEKKPEVTEETIPSEKKPEVNISEKKPEVTIAEKEPELNTAEKKPEVTTAEKKLELTPTEKKTEVTPAGKKPEKTPTVTERKLEVTKERKPSDKKPPIMGVKPFALPRDRSATAEPGFRPTAPHPRDRAGTSEKTSVKPTPDEAAPASLPVKKPPRFGIGIGGAAGGGLLAEMKLRQERAASLGRVSES